MTTNEEVALALREIKEAKIIPSYIEKPMGIEGVTVNTDEMFDLVINALKENTALNLLIDWAIQSGFSFDSFPEEYEKYKEDIEGLEYKRAMIYIAKKELEGASEK